jgi:glutamine---fructose-6-phosphate transaminase (isomerizing)
MSLRDEIFEQPVVARRLLDEAHEPIERIAADVQARDVDHVVIAARGTSDHAAIYAQYLFGVLLRLPVALAVPSVLSLYGAEPRFRRALVVGISQSGVSPDVVGIVEAGRRQGVPTVAITNDPASALAAAAEHVVDLRAGPELAVAATKTYTAELMAVAMLGSALADGPGRAAELAVVPAAMEEALRTEEAAAGAAADHAGMRSCTVLGRGFDYATAREWALKLKELTHVLADPYSAADFLHGPLALVEPGFPVLALAPSGRASADLVALLERLVRDHEVDLLVASDREEIRALGRWSLALPAGLPEWLTPLVSILPAQLFALHLTRARGLDTEAPRHIAKVTRTH